MNEAIIISVITIVMTKLVNFFTVLVVNNFPIRKVFLTSISEYELNHNTNNNYLAYGEGVNFKLNLDLRSKESVIEDIRLYVPHGLSEEYILREISARSTIYFSVPLEEIEVYIKYSDSFPLGLKTVNFKLISRVFNFWFSNNEIISNYQNNRYSRKIEALKSKYIDYDLPIFAFPHIYLKIRSNGIVREYHVFAVIADGMF